MTNKENVFKWDLCLEPITSNVTTTKFAVILLNYCFDNLLSQENLGKTFFEPEKFRYFQLLWNNSSVRMAVDGGTNTFHDLKQSNLKHNLDKHLLDPTFITGDFDSIRTDVMDYFKRKESVRILHTPDQNYTDFTKALFVLKESLQNPNNSDPIDSILVFYTKFGRMDQYLSILSTVHQFNQDKILPPIILIDMIDSISFVLNKGSHQIPRFSNSKWCSLIPLCGPVTLSTTGFRWNLENSQKLEFGKFISSSNEFNLNSGHVTVNVVDKQILFSADFKF